MTSGNMGSGRMCAFEVFRATVIKRRPKIAVAQPVQEVIGKHEGWEVEGYPVEDVDASREADGPVRPELGQGLAEGRASLNARSEADPVGEEDRVEEHA
jgi:hypothetical protein